MEQEKPLQKSPYRTLIGQHFDYSMDWEFLDIVAELVDSIDLDEYKEKKANDEGWDYLFDIVNEGLIYTSEQWAVIGHYQMPDRVDLLDAMDDLTADIEAIVDKIIDE